LQKKIFTPGPTQVPPSVLSETIQHTTYHRSDEFKSFYTQLLQKLKKIFSTEQNVHVLTTSGTGAMEAAVVNFCEPNSNILFLNQGRFGERWGSICRAHGINSEELKVEYGTTVSIDDLRKTELAKYNAVFLTHSETSTATLTDIKNLTAFIKNNSDALIIVDAITAVAAIEFKMDEWKIDVAVSASQKGLMSPPGLAFIAYGEDAKKRMFDNKQPRFFFDLRKEFKETEKGLTTWTPAVGLMYGVDEACNIILNKGLENTWKEVTQMAEHFRNETAKNCFRLYSSTPTDSLTALMLPDDMSSTSLINALKSKHGLQTANGQDELNGKIIRVSHMGDLNLDDIKKFTSIMLEEFELLKNESKK